SCALATLARPFAAMIETMLILADENMPLVREAFAPLGEVRTVNGRHMQPDEIRDADVLLVRSVTRIDESLLKHSRVRFVGTATIGTDHIDTEYIRERGIAMASAPGSNANAVVDYVLSALCALDDTLERLSAGGAVGVIGLGNVGSRVVARLQSLRIDCIGFDPLLPAQPGLSCASLEELLAADVVCCHAPLTRDGAFPSLHMLDAAHLQQLRPGAVLLNAGRGGVIDGSALSRLLQFRDDVRVVLDVWEGEPAIDCDLLARVTLGTPHIAGYSLDGKIAGTRMMLEACCRYFDVALPAWPEPIIAAPRFTVPVSLS